MADIARHVTALIDRITRGDGRANREARAAAFSEARGAAARQGRAARVSRDRRGRRRREGEAQRGRDLRARRLHRGRPGEAPVRQRAGGARRSDEKGRVMRLAILDSRSRVRHEGAVRVHPHRVARSAVPDVVKLSCIAPEFFGSADERGVPGGDARAVRVVRRRPRADGGVRLEDKRMRVLNECSRRGRGEGLRMTKRRSTAVLADARQRADRREAARDPALLRKLTQRARGDRGRHARRARRRRHEGSR